MNLKRILIVILFTAYSTLMYGQSISKTMLRLPDTGETQSYTNTFGEDNDYLINVPFFIDNLDGTITDTITGLMWQKLLGGEMTIENARTYCDTLTIGTYSDWRLPNAHESFSILNHQYSNPAIKTSIFPDSLVDYWWTSTVQKNDSNKIWVTNAGGGIGPHPKTETISAGGNKIFRVRAVRDITTPVTLPNHFTNNNDGTITDNLTELVWQQSAYNDSLSWEQALNYADTNQLGNLIDWRLPNIKELQSLNDETKTNPSINSLFNIGSSFKAWSSTTLPNQTTKAWYIDTQFGITTYDYKTVRHNVILVRGPINSITGDPELENSARNMIVFPNPFVNYINVTSNTNTVFLLLDILGRTIYKGANIQTQNFSQLPKGIYILKSVTENYGIKIIKQ